MRSALEWHTTGYLLGLKHSTKDSKWPCAARLPRLAQMRTQQNVTCSWQHVISWFFLSWRGREVPWAGVIHCSACSFEKFVFWYFFVSGELKETWLRVSWQTQATSSSLSYPFRSHNMIVPTWSWNGRWITASRFGCTVKKCFLLQLS